MSSVTSEEFLWSCDLTAAKKEYSWAPQVTTFSKWPEDEASVGYPQILSLGPCKGGGRRGRRWQTYAQVRNHIACFPLWSRYFSHSDLTLPVGCLSSLRSWCPPPRRTRSISFRSSLRATTRKRCCSYSGVGPYDHAFCTYLGQRTVHGSFLEPMCYMKYSVSRRQGVFLDARCLSKAGNKLACHGSVIIFNSLHRIMNLHN